MWDTHCTSTRAICYKSGILGMWVNSLSLVLRVTVKRTYPWGALVEKPIVLCGQDYTWFLDHSASNPLIFVLNIWKEVDLYRNTNSQNCVNRQPFILHICLDCSSTNMSRTQGDIFRTNLMNYWGYSAQSWWDINLTNVKINKPISVAIIKSTNCMTECSWEVLMNSWIFRPIFASS